MRGITPAYHRNDIGKLLDCNPRLGMDGGPAGGLVLRCEGSAALVAVTAARYGTQATRTFHIGLQRACWLSVAGWDQVTVEIKDIGPTGATAYAAWTDNAPPQLSELVYMQAIPAPLVTQKVPEGAIAVIPSLADAGATQVMSLVPPITTNSPLVVGQRTEIVGSELILTVAPQVLSWILEGF